MRLRIGNVKVKGLPKTKRQDTLQAALATAPPAVFNTAMIPTDTMLCADLLAPHVIPVLLGNIIVPAVTPVLLYLMIIFWNPKL